MSELIDGARNYQIALGAEPVLKIRTQNDEQTRSFIAYAGFTVGTPKNPLVEEELVTVSPYRAAIGRYTTDDFSIRQLISENIHNILVQNLVSSDDLEERVAALKDEANGKLTLLGSGLILVTLGLLKQDESILAQGLNAAAVKVLGELYNV